MPRMEDAKKAEKAQRKVMDSWFRLLGRIFGKAMRVDLIKSHDCFCFHQIHYTLNHPFVSHMASEQLTGWRKGFR